MNLDIWGFLIVLLIAAVIGLVAKGIAGFSRGGLLVAIAIGFVGALLGIWIHTATGAPELLTVEVGNTHFPIVWSIIGGVVFVCFVSLFTRPRRVVV
jgi:uncharacterized membrane protein YeaQ/YmgE (transglycosylase-associated protein family)